MLFIMNHAQFEPANGRKRPPGSPPNGPRTRHWRRRRPSIRAPPLPARLAPLAETARDYARAADVAKHQPRLRRRLAPLLRLGAAAEPPCPAPGSASSRPLHRRLRLRRGRPEAVLGQHHRAAPLGAHVEFRPARPADGPQGPARRHRAGGDPPHPGPPARAEGGHPARGSPRHDRHPRSRRSPRPARSGDPPRSVSPAACAARKSSASIAAPRTASAAAGSNFSTTDCC